MLNSGWVDAWRRVVVLPVVYTVPTIVPGCAAPVLVCAILCFLPCSPGAQKPVHTLLLLPHLSAGCLADALGPYVKTVKSMRIQRIQTDLLLFACIIILFKLLAHIERLGVSLCM